MADESTHADASAAKPKRAVTRLAKEDIDAILYAKDLKSGTKLASEHYHIGSARVYSIWKAADPYGCASLCTPNLPSWFRPGGPAVGRETKDTAPEPRAAATGTVVAEAVGPAPKAKSAVKREKRRQRKKDLKEIAEKLCAVAMGESSSGQ